MKTYDTDLIRGYISRTFPAQWAIWWASIEDEQARKNLGKVIFDGEELKDLTHPALRTEVIDCVLAHPTLVAMVATECDKVINKMVANMHK